MSKLSKQRAKEELLKSVEPVTKETAFDEIKNNTEGLDLYTYFVTKDAFKTGILQESDINEFLIRVYSDWYFLHKNTANKNPKAVKILSEYEFSPVNLSGNRCFELVKNGRYKDVLPVFFQYINKLEDRYFICVKTDELYNRKFDNFKYEVRLYINLPCEKLLEFAKEFLDKAYTEEFPALLKILNNDYRCDTVTIYTDYEYAQKVIDVINEIKVETKSIFEVVGPVSKLLGNIDDYIGFGEQLENNATYFSSRCQALSSINRFAGLETLRDGIVAKEKQIIFMKDGTKYTPTEYLTYLVERNAVRLVEDKIQELEKDGIECGEELDRLYSMRENVGIGVDLEKEVNNLKKSLTHKLNYSLKINGVGEDNYNYLNKLYNLFTTEDERLLKFAGDKERKNKIKSKLFKCTEEFSGVNTKEFLDIYFKAELGIVLKEFIDNELEGVKRTKQSEVLNNIKKKSITRLKCILKSILDDGDEGREYINDCIYDYVRILSTGSTENVQVYIDGRELTIDKDINTDILSMLPELEQKFENLSVSIGFIDKTLAEFGINKDNLCINKQTKNIFKERVKEDNLASRYYYNPEGYLSKEEK
ncbi:MAG: hypothetical protein ACI4PF_02725 [Christensenellales bacterium]